MYCIQIEGIKSQLFVNVSAQSCGDCVLDWCSFAGQCNSSIRVLRFYCSLARLEAFQEG